MKVSIQQDITLDHRTVKRVFEAHLDVLCGGHGTYLKGAYLECWDSAGHGSGTVYRLGKATPLQKAAIALREKLKKESMWGT